MLPPLVTGAFLYGLIWIYKAVKYNSLFREYSVWFVIVVVCLVIMMAPLPI